MASDVLTWDEFVARENAARAQIREARRLLGEDGAALEAL